MAHKNTHIMQVYCDNVVTKLLYDPLQDPYIQENIRVDANSNYILPIK